MWYVVAHVLNPITVEAEAEGSGVLSMPESPSIMLCSKQTI